MNSESGSGSYTVESNYAPTHNIYSSRVPHSWSVAPQEKFLFSFTPPEFGRLSSVRPWIDDIAGAIERTRTDRIERDAQPVAYLSSEPRKWALDAAFEIWGSGAYDVNFVRDFLCFGGERISERLVVNRSADFLD